MELTKFKQYTMKSGQITKEVSCIDINQYQIPRICSSFLIQTDKSVVLLDIGTSNEVDYLLDYLHNHQIPLSSIDYLVPSHFHFDHFGGGWRLWEYLRKFNPDIKILTTKKTMKLLQDPFDHLERAKRTFGDFVGEMKPIPTEAFEIISTDKDIPIEGLSDKNFQLVSTPGHTEDHVCPTIFIDDIAEFMYVAEAAGTTFNSEQLVTLPTSMPPDFHFDNYIKSLDKIVSSKPANIGYCHFGYVNSQENVYEILNENRDLSFFFRDFVKSKFEEYNRKMRPIVEEFVEKEIPRRSNFPDNKFLVPITVALVYGQLIDLGLKRPK